MICLYWRTAPNPYEQAVFEVGESQPHMGDDSGCRAVPRPRETGDNHVVVVYATEFVYIRVVARLRQRVVRLVQHRDGCDLFYLRRPDPSYPVSIVAQSCRRHLRSHGRCTSSREALDEGLYSEVLGRRLDEVVKYTGGRRRLTICPTVRKRRGAVPKRQPCAAWGVHIASQPDASTSGS